MSLSKWLYSECFFYSDVLRQTRQKYVNMHVIKSELWLRFVRCRISIKTRFCLQSVLRTQTVSQQRTVTVYNVQITCRKVQRNIPKFETTHARSNRPRVVYGVDRRWNFSLIRTSWSLSSTNISNQIEMCFRGSQIGTINRSRCRSRWRGHDDLAVSRGWRLTLEYKVPLENDASYTCGFLSSDLSAWVRDVRGHDVMRHCLDAFLTGSLRCQNHVPVVERKFVRPVNQPITAVSHFTWSEVCTKIDFVLSANSAINQLYQDLSEFQDIGVDEKSFSKV